MVRVMSLGSFLELALLTKWFDVATVKLVVLGDDNTSLAVVKLMFPACAAVDCSLKQATPACTPFFVLIIAPTNWPFTSWMVLSFKKPHHQSEAHSFRLRVYWRSINRMIATNGPCALLFIRFMFRSIHFIQVEETKTSVQNLIHFPSFSLAALIRLLGLRCLATPCPPFLCSKDCVAHSSYQSFFVWQSYRLIDQMVVVSSTSTKYCRILVIMPIRPSEWQRKIKQV